jgi:phosphate uptake regulator
MPVKRRKEIFSNIKLIDDEAEKVGSRFIELYSDVENLSYSRFAEMSLLLARKDDLKADFSRHIVALIPDVNKLKRHILPEIQSELDNLIVELQKDCKLSVLRSDKLFTDREYSFDDTQAFKLPENDMDGWIFLSIRSIRRREREKQRMPHTENASFVSKVFKRMW